MLYYELAKLAPDTRAELELYEMWLMGEKKVLPKAGGFLDQPASVMQALKRIDLKQQLAERILELQRKQLQQMANLSKAFGSNGEE